MNRPRRIKQFLQLYPAATARTLRRVLIISVLLAVLDFTSLLLLLPVFGALATGSSDTSAAAVQLPGPLRDVSAEALVVLAMALMIGRSVAGFLVRYGWSRRVAEAEVSLSSRLLSAYAYAPYQFHLRRNSADLLSRAVAHVNACTGPGLNGVVLLATDGTTVAALGAALFVANPIAGSVVLAYVAIIGYLFVSLSRRFTAKQAEAYANEVGQVYRRASTILRGVRELTVAGGRQAVLDSIDRARTRMVRAQRNMFVLTDVPRVTLETALYLAILVSLFVVLGKTDASDSLPVVALYVVAGLRILPAITRCLGNLSSLRSGLEIGRQVALEFTELEAFPSAAAGADPLPRKGSLTLDRVSFTYDNISEVMSDVELDVPYGQFVAVVGPSGSGKSTLLGILLGLLGPTHGEVRYGGAFIGLSDPEWLRHVGYVPQETFVLDDNVRTNVALGDPKPNDGRIWESLDRAALGRLVRTMESQLDEPLGEGGSRLSVGQRQRLGLARALYRDPSVLILDEPTAALDRKSESQVMETINALKGALTIVLVAHRLETIEAADVVAQMDNGRLKIVPMRDSLPKGSA